MTKRKSLQHIENNTRYVEAEFLSNVYLTFNKQIACYFKIDGVNWHGEIQRVYLDKDGEAYAYDVYIY